MSKLIVLSSLSLLFVSCFTNQRHNMEVIPYEILREENMAIELPEIQTFHSMDELTAFYGQIQDPSFTRSAPIPFFDSENETIIAIHPTLKKLEFGGIEIEEIKQIGSEVIVTYQELESWEANEKLWKNPLLIIKVQKLINKKTIKLIN